MQIKNYSIVNTKFANDSYVHYEGYLDKKIKVNIFEFYKNKLRIDDINDVIYKILIPANIGNPIEILSCFIGFNENLFIILPYEYEELSKVRGVYLDYNIDDLNYFLNKDALTKLLIINGKQLSGKSYFANILNIYFVIKNYETFYFTSIYKLSTDIEIINYMIESFFKDENEDKLLNKNIQFGYFQEKYQKLFAAKLLAFASKNPVVVFFDNIDILSKNLQNLILGIYKMIQLTPGKFPVIFCLISTNSLNHILIDEEFSRNSFKRIMPSITFIELKKLADFVEEIKKNEKNANQPELLHHLYKITEGNLSDIQFVLSRINSRKIAWDDSFLKQNMTKLYSEELTTLDKLDLKILSIFKSIKIPLSFLTFKYITPICIGKEYQFDDVYNSILKLKNLIFISSTIVNHSIYMYLSYRQMIPYIPDHPDPAIIYEACGDYFKNTEKNNELVLYCYLNSKNIEKTMESLEYFIDYYKRLYDFEPIIFYLDKVLQKYPLTQEKRFELLYEKAEIYFHLSLWFESLSMLYELLPYSKRLEDIYFYICYNYYYLGEYNSLEEFIDAYQHFIYSNPILKIKIGFIQAPILCIKNEREKALSLLDELYNLIKEEKKEVLLKDYYICCSNCFYILNEINKAKEMLSKAELKKDDVQSIPYFMEIYLLQSKFALFEKQYNLSLSWATKGLNLCESYYNLRYLSDFYTIIGLNLYYLKNYNSTLLYLKKASKLKEELNHIFDLGIIEYYEACTLFKLGNFSQCVSKTFKASHIFKILEAKDYYKNAQILLIKAEFELRNYERAFYLLRALSKNYEFSFEEKSELLFYMTKIKETIISMNNTIDMILETQDFTKIPTFFSSLRNSSISFDDMSLKLIYSLQHIVDQTPHFEKVYEEILSYLTNYSKSDISYLILIYPSNEFKIVAKYSPISITTIANKETIFELLKLKILYEEKVTTLSYDNENIVAIPLYRLSRLPTSRAKKISSRVRRNYIGFILLFFSVEPKKEVIFSITNSYNIINSIIVNSIEYSKFSKEDDYTYRFKVFKEIVIREAYNCYQESHNFAFCFIKIEVVEKNKNSLNFRDIIKEFGYLLHKLFRNEDLITRLSENEYFIFLPFAEKTGETSLKLKIVNAVENLFRNQNKEDIYNLIEVYSSFIFNEPCSKNIVIDIDLIIEQLKKDAIKIQLNQEL